MTRSRLLIFAIAAAVLVTGAAFGVRELISSPEPSSSATSTAVSTATPTSAPGPTRTTVGAATTPSGYVRFTNERAGFSIAYPKAWSRLKSRDPAVELLVAQGRATSLLVRRAPVGLDVTEKTLPVVRDLTDSLVRAGRGVRQIRKPEPLTLGGLPGYRYVYTFESSKTTQGVHVHLFLFKGGQMITLVFQAIPASRLEEVAPLIEKIATTFRGNLR